MERLKTFEQRVNDLLDHATLLSEACERFRQQHKLNEVRNIATYLRTLVCLGRGNNLLFELTINNPLMILVLENHIEMTIQEIEPNTGNIIQIVTKRKLLTNPIKNQPTLPIITTKSNFAPWLKNVVFQEWLENGFLMDWEVPNDTGQTPEITRLTPRKLIKCYANKEASHSDKYFANEFGCSFNEEKELYVFNGKKMMIPIVYNYLYQIGQVTAKLSIDYCSQILSKKD